MLEIANKSNANGAVIPIFSVVALYPPAHTLENFPILADEKVPGNVGKVLAGLIVALRVAHVATALVKGPAGAVPVSGMVDDDVLGPSVEGASALSRWLGVPFNSTDVVSSATTAKTVTPLVVVEVVVRVS